jgi:hypothetical protein
LDRKRESISARIRSPIGDELRGGTRIHKVAGEIGLAPAPFNASLQTSLEVTVNCGGARVINMI